MAYKIATCLFIAIVSISVYEFGRAYIDAMVTTKAQEICHG